MESLLLIGGFFCCNVLDKNTVSNSANVSLLPVKTINIAQINVQGMNTTHKLTLLEDYCSQNSLDVVCIQEHWYSHNDLEFVIFPGLKLASYWARSSHIRGGATILVRDTYDFTQLDF